MRYIYLYILYFYYSIRKECSNVPEWQFSAWLSMFQPEHSPEHSRNILFQCSGLKICKWNILRECSTNVPPSGTLFFIRLLNYFNRSKPRCFPQYPKRRDVVLRSQLGSTDKALLISILSLRCIRRASPPKHSHHISSAHTLSRSTSASGTCILPFRN